MKIENYENIFWDFDGVIKDSLNIKTEAFYSLFIEFGRDSAKKIKKHHIQNSGISRFDKIPLYLEWSNQDTSEKNVSLYIKKFKDLVVHKVIESPWVKGAEEYLNLNSFNQRFFIVTATPQEEIEYILERLNIIHLFFDIKGSPGTKAFSIDQSIKGYNLKKKKCLMIGDAKADLNAACKNKIDFVLRVHEENENIKGEKGIKAIISNIGEL